MYVCVRMLAKTRRVEALSLV